MLYVVDHVTSSRYISIYCKKIHDKPGRGRDIPIVLLEFKTAMLKFHVAFPLSIEEIKENVPKSVWKKLWPFTIAKGSRFKTMALGGIDVEGLSMLAKILAHFVNTDQIILPGKEE